LVLATPLPRQWAGSDEVAGRDIETDTVFVYSWRLKTFKEHRLSDGEVVSSGIWANADEPRPLQGEGGHWLVDRAQISWVDSEGQRLLRDTEYLRSAYAVGASLVFQDFTGIYLLSPDGTTQFCDHDEYQYHQMVGAFDEGLVLQDPLESLVVVDLAGQVQCELPAESAWLQRVAIDQQGQWLAVGNRHVLSLWDVAQCQPVGAIELERNVGDLNFVGDELWSTNPTMHFDRQTLEAIPIKNWQRHSSFTVLADEGNPLLHVGDELIDPVAGTSRRFAGLVAVAPDRLIEHLDSDVIVSTPRGREIARFTATTLGRSLWTEVGANSTAISDGRQVLHLKPDGTIEQRHYDSRITGLSLVGDILDVRTSANEGRFRIRPHHWTSGIVSIDGKTQSAVELVDPSAHGKFLLRHTTRGVVTWDRSTGRDLGEVLEIEIETGTVSPDGRLAVVQVDGALQAWATATGQLLWHHEDPLFENSLRDQGLRIDQRAIVVIPAKALSARRSRPATYDSVAVEPGTILLDPKTGKRIWSVKSVGSSSRVWETVEITTDEGLFQTNELNSARPAYVWEYPNLP
ncbi:MAG: PQQ-binding-like beta-propeller repeat protein, partial [Proteobacteria bacterium]|nr:PQQ-binding-like beta-propeller repeat protein [Pseudomonadota bacterium]